MLTKKQTYTTPVTHNSTFNIHVQSIHFYGMTYHIAVFLFVVMQV